VAHPLIDIACANCPCRLPPSLLTIYDSLLTIYDSRNHFRIAYGAKKCRR
jgi:hypothetical protein